MERLTTLKGHSNDHIARIERACSRIKYANEAAFFPSGKFRHIGIDKSVGTGEYSYQVTEFVEADTYPLGIGRTLEGVIQVMNRIAFLDWLRTQAHEHES